MTQQRLFSRGPVELLVEGDGPDLLLLHGALVDETLWDDVADRLRGTAERPGYRLLRPTLPLGAHRQPVDPDTDLSPDGVADLVAALLGEHGHSPVTVVASDSAVALTQLLLLRHPGLVARAVLTSGDAGTHFFPPRFRPLQLAARLPGGLQAVARALQLPAVRSSSLGFGTLSRRGISQPLAVRWSTPLLSDAGVRRDTRRFLAAVHPRVTLAALARLGEVQVPVLLAWGADDRAFPRRLAEQLRDALPDARLVDVPDSAAFVPLDAPGHLAELVREFAPL